MSEHVFQQVRDLDLPLGSYAIFGSGPIGIRGWRLCHDADLVVTADLFERLRRQDGWTADVKNGEERLCRGDIEVWRGWRPGRWDIEGLIENAEIIDGLPFVRLAEVLRWKGMMGRDKDLADIDLIKKKLAES